MKAMIPEDQLPQEAQDLLRFIRAYTRDQKPDKAARAAAMALCQTRIQELTTQKFKGSGRPKRRTPYMDSPEFTIALHLARKAITKAEAINRYMDLKDCGRTTAIEHLRDLEENAKAFAGVIDLLNRD